jgi:hypothetical protein
MRQRPGQEGHAPVAAVEQVAGGQVAALQVVGVHAAAAGHPEVDQGERQVHVAQQVDHLGLEEAGGHQRVGLVHAQQVAHRVGRAGAEHGGHHAELAAGLFHAVHHLREERVEREAAVVAVHHEQQPTRLGRTQPARVVAELAGDLAHLAARLVRQAALVLQGARHGADRHAGGDGDVAHGDVLVDGAHGVGPPVGFALGFAVSR